MYKYPVRCARHAATVPKLETKTLTLTVGSRFKIWMKILLINLRISSKIESKIKPKPIKSDLLGCLGGVWRPFWSVWAVLEGFGDPFGAKRVPRNWTMRKCWIFDDLGVIWGSKMEPKSIKNCSKIDSFFITILKDVFINLGWILVPKTSPKW